MTQAEHATLSFYQFEYLHRGYYYFDMPVNIEPPYKPYRMDSILPPKEYDDGRVPSLLKSLYSSFTSKKIQEQEVVEEPSAKIEVVFDETTVQRVVYSLKLPQGIDVPNANNSEFLALLSSTVDVLSYEIVGTKETISIYVTCSDTDSLNVYAQLTAFFPYCEIEMVDGDTFQLDTERPVAIADFGLRNECMFPMKVLEGKGNDPLISFIGMCEQLEENETVLLQILFKGATTPIATDILSAVSDGQGNCFFIDCPEMLKEAQIKVAEPLMYAIVRIAVQSTTNEKSKSLASGIVQSISTISRSLQNSLIPLSNEGYDYHNHLYNVYARKSNRLGMLLNTRELATIVHIPQPSIVSSKLFPEEKRTKILPSETINQPYILGINNHKGKKEKVSLSEELFGKHLCIGGATGTGKTYLLKQLVRQSFNRENATFVIDPHGDLVSDIIGSISEADKERVVYLNIADEDVAFCLNIFEANSEAEKTVLVSDLAQAFSDTWISSGDRIQSVLQKTIATFVYSNKEGSILDMKRFLLEAPFRKEFLSSLDDPILQYYWQNEFPLVRRNELSPLLLRIDTFMQTRLLQTMFAERKGIDIKVLIEQKKLVLVQLSVGLIGLTNSVFIAKLLIAKINQVAFARQRIHHSERNPIHLYIDEAHYYAHTPSIEHILSGARKYSLSLILAIQHLEQVPSHLLNSLLGNAGTQIFFRQSDKDSKRIANGYSFFEPTDFMELDRGEALVRITKRSGDCNMKTIYEEPLTQDPTISEYIIEHSRNTLGTSRADIQKNIAHYLPKISGTLQKDSPLTKNTTAPLSDVVANAIIPKTNDAFQEQKEAFLNDTKEKEVLQKHRMFQQLVRTMALQRGFKATIEESLENGGRVDVGLTKDDLWIAVEVSVTNTNDYEVQNIQKCIEAGYSHIFMMSESKIHLKNINAKCKELIEKKHQKIIYFFTPNELGDYFEKVQPINPKQEEIKRVRGYRVKSSHIELSDTNSKEKKQSLKELIQQTFKNKKK